MTMPASVQMTTAQTVAIGVTILDQGKPPQPFDTLPDGVTITFTSSDPNIAPVTVRPDGMNADVASEKVGTATITVHADGLATAVLDDTVTITIKNAAVGSLNLTVGAPTDE